MRSGRRIALLTCLAGCGPQVSAGDGPGTGDASAADASSESVSNGDDPTAITSGATDPSVVDDSGGSTGEPPPTQTWCIDSRTFPGSAGDLHVLDLDGDGPELWSVRAEMDPRTREATTHFTVQRFDGRTLTEVDQFSRSGSLLTFGDVDGDGLDDAIMRTEMPAEAQWLAGEASGQFAATGLPFAIAQQALFGDRNGDGALDAIGTAGDGAPAVELHLGDGEGGFSFGGSLDLELDDTTFYLDAHTLADGNVLILAEGWCPGLCGSPTLVVIAHVEESGTLPELARFSTDSAVRPLASTDRNGDGLPDLLLDYWDSRSPRVAWHDSPGYRETIHIEPIEVARSEDFDLDGAVDVIEWLGFGEPVAIRFGVAGEGLGPPQPLVGELESIPSARADLDGDGRLDLASHTERPDTLSLWSIVPCEG
jgi:hypothetical protein